MDPLTHSTKNSSSEKTETVSEEKETMVNPLSQNEKRGLLGLLNPVQWLVLGVLAVLVVAQIFDIDIGIKPRGEPGGKGWSFTSSFNKENSVSFHTQYYSRRRAGNKIT